jgi:hypothetical protein
VPGQKTDTRGEGGKDQKQEELAGPEPVRNFSNPSPAKFMLLLIEAEILTETRLDIARPLKS